MLIVWIIVIIFACLLEVASQLQLVSVWAAVGGIAALISDVFGVDSKIQIVIFFAVTFAALALTRPLVRKLTKSVPDLPSNADMNIGKTGKVTKIVNESEGLFRVSIAGDDWSAITTDPIMPEVGASVKVERIEGVKLVVSQVC